VVGDGVKKKRFGTEREIIFSKIPINFFVNVISNFLVPFPYIWALAEFEKTSWLF
jgi:hypothetical protein